MSKRVDRRRALATLAASFGALPLAGCDLFSQNPTVRKVLDSAESLTMHAQRLLVSRQALAQEFTEADISADFRANGSTDPDDDAYQTFAQSGFKDWRLQVDGLVERPVQLSLGELRALPARTQITRHDCVEGWSCIGKWTGVPLSIVLQRAGLKPDARYIVFYCADSPGQWLEAADKYYESIDLIDALHPQTILAYDMNGAPLIRLPLSNFTEVKPTLVGLKENQRINPMQSKLPRQRLSHRRLRCMLAQPCIRHLARSVYRCLPTGVTGSRSRPTPPGFGQIVLCRPDAWVPCLIRAHPRLDRRLDL